MTAERAMYKARVEQAKNYIDHLLKPLQHANEANVPLAALTQKRAAEFENVWGTTKATREWIEDVTWMVDQIMEDVTCIELDAKWASQRVQSIRGEVEGFQKSVDTPLPVIMAFFWTYSQIATVQQILGLMISVSLRIGTGSWE